jgi:hypothetical protein
MDPKWHIAFLNISITQYAGVTFKEYYSSPARTLEAQIKASETVENRFGVGRFIKPFIDTPTGTLSSLLGMKVVFPEGVDELPSVDPRSAVIHDVADVDKVRVGDPRKDSVMALRLRAWQYYRDHGYPRDLGGFGGPIVTTACEVSGDSVLMGLVENPDAACRLFDLVMEAGRAVDDLATSLRGKPSTGGGGYIGDDYAGLLSPEMFRKYVIPRYQKIYAGKTSRFMHSELLRREHLQIARDLLDITDFHGAGCEKLTFEEMREVMGHKFWTQVTPHEMIALTPAELAERVKVMANCGAWRVQLYPGRGTPDSQMEAAIAALRKECRGGPV